MLTSDQDERSLRSTLAMGAGLATGVKAMGAAFVRRMGGMNALTSPEAYKAIRSWGAQEASRNLGERPGVGSCWAGCGLRHGGGNRTCSQVR